MSFKYALLATLADEAKHGYAIRTTLQEIIGPFWPVGQGQVYATLERTRRDGFTSACGDRANQDPPRRVTHRLTDAGRRRLLTWLANTSAVERNDGLGFDDWLAHLAVAERRGDAEGLALTIAVHRARCTRLRNALGKQNAHRPDAAIRLAHELLTVELQWLDDLEREIDADPCGEATRL